MSGAYAIALITATGIGVVATMIWRNGRDSPAAAPGTRRAGFVVISLLALLTIWAAGASRDETRELVGDALRDARLNESSSDSAPQQQVVNGWVTRDLLTIQAHSDLLAEERISLMLLFVVFALAWNGLTSFDPREADPQQVAIASLPPRPPSPTSAAPAPAPAPKTDI